VVPHKSRYFIVVGKSTVKTVANKHGYGCCLSQQALVTSFLVVLASMTLKHLKLLK